MMSVISSESVYIEYIILESPIGLWDVPFVLIICHRKMSMLIVTLPKSAKCRTWSCCFLKTLEILQTQEVFRGFLHMYPLSLSLCPFVVFLWVAQMGTHGAELTRQSLFFKKTSLHKYIFLFTPWVNKLVAHSKTHWLIPSLVSQ